MRSQKTVKTAIHATLPLQLPDAGGKFVNDAATRMPRADILFISEISLYLSFDIDIEY